MKKKVWGKYQFTCNWGKKNDFYYKTKEKKDGRANAKR